MSSFADAVRGMRDILLLQRDVRDLEEGVTAQRTEIDKMSGSVIDLDKRLFAVERIMDLGMKQKNPRQIEE